MRLPGVITTGSHFRCVSGSRAVVQCSSGRGCRGGSRSSGATSSSRAGAGGSRPLPLTAPRMRKSPRNLQTLTRHCLCLLIAGRHNRYHFVQHRSELSQTGRRNDDCVSSSSDTLRNFQETTPRVLLERKHKSFALNLDLFSLQRVLRCRCLLASQ